MTDITSHQMIDIARPDHVEIEFSKTKHVLWVNVDGICRLRITGDAVHEAFDALMQAVGVKGEDGR